MLRNPSGFATKHSLAYEPNLVMASNASSLPQLQTSVF